MRFIVTRIRSRLSSSPFLVFLAVLVVLFCIEIGIMFLMPYISPSSNEVTSNFIDAMLLTTLCAPFLWHLIVTPIRDQAQATRVRSEAVLANVADCVVVFDEAGEAESANRAFFACFGYEEGDVRGISIGNLVAPVDLDKVIEPVRTITEGTGDSVAALECHAITKAGHVFPAEVSVSRVGDGRAGAYLAIFRDITERKSAEAELIHLATHDHLTHLPNRGLFQKLVDEKMADARSSQTGGVVGFIDLDNLKFVNDTIGHEAGDVLLRTLGERMKKCLGAGGVLARVGGDEFTFLVCGESIREQAAVVAGKVLAAIKEPIKIGANTIYSTGSIGMAFFPGDATSAESITRAADIAMYSAKKRGKNGYMFFCPTMEDELSAMVALEAELQRALAQGEFALAYQPRVAAETGRVVGMEALLRWMHPEKGTILPGTFIPVAEETGLIVPLGEWVLKEAVRQAAVWKRQGYDFVVSINISAKQLASPVFASEVLAAAAAENLPADALELELTESVAIENFGQVTEFIRVVKEAGMNVAIDDFGTGYSSLSCLTKLPIDTIKLDRGFVMKLPESADDATIAKTVISMGKCLSLRIVAEGVETPDQAAFLTAYGCDELQGFFFGKPVFAAEFERVFLNGVNHCEVPDEEEDDVPDGFEVLVPA